MLSSNGVANEWDDAMGNVMMLGQKILNPRIGNHILFYPNFLPILRLLQS